MKKFKEHKRWTTRSFRLESILRRMYKESVYIYVPVPKYGYVKERNETVRNLKLWSEYGNQIGLENIVA